jgi:hypothetical protein
MAFFCILKVTEERSRIRSWTPDPDPHQNVTDPQHWLENNNIEKLEKSKCAVLQTAWVGPFLQRWGLKMPWSGVPHPYPFRPGQIHLF